MQNFYILIKLLIVVDFLKFLFALELFFIHRSFLLLPHKLSVQFDATVAKDFGTKSEGLISMKILAQSNDTVFSFSSTADDRLQSWCKSHKQQHSRHRTVPSEGKEFYFHLNKFQTFTPLTTSEDLSLSTVRPTIAVNHLCAHSLSLLRSGTACLCCIFISGSIREIISV